MKSEKALALVLCILGVSSVAYGMIRENNVLFVAGLFWVVGGYLIIRRKLKDHAKNQNP